MKLVSRHALAATVHDRAGAFLPGLHQWGSIVRDIFGGVGVLATESTASEVVTFLESDLGAIVSRAPADGRVGRHRRDSVRLALQTDPSTVFYSDLDHLLRWISADRAELRRIVEQRSADFDVIGRSARAMLSCPARLRATEQPINRIYRLLTGRDWDLMFAVRAISALAAQAVVDMCGEDSIASDVEWPIAIERAGFTLGYREADALSYRIAQDFGASVDDHDDDPRAWIERIEIANLHAKALRRLLGGDHRFSSIMLSARVGSLRSPTVN